MQPLAQLPALAPLQPAVNRASAQYGVPTSIINSVILHESSGNPHAVSSAGALGLMQLEPGTAQEYGASDPFNPGQNIDAGTRYLESLHAQAGNWTTALEYYNQGQGSVMEHGAYPGAQQYARNVLSDAQAQPGSPPLGKSGARGGALPDSKSTIFSAIAWVFSHPEDVLFIVIGLVMVLFAVAQLAKSQVDPAAVDATKGAGVGAAKGAAVDAVLA